MLVDSYGDIINKIYAFHYYEKDKEKQVSSIDWLIAQPVITIFDE